MSATIGLGTTITEAEFCRRVVIAFRAVDLSVEKGTFIQNCLSTIQRGAQLSEPQLTALCKAVLRKRGEITDKSVIDFASPRTKAY